MDANKGIHGVNVGHLWGETAMLKRQLDAIVGLWEAGVVRPVVDAVVPFAEAPAAHLRLMERRNVGKVVLVP